MANRPSRRLRPRALALLSAALAYGLFPSIAVAQSTPVLSSYQVSQSSGTTSLTLSGSGFGTSDSGATVTVDGISAPITAWSDTTITVTLPNNAGPGTLQVATPVGTSNAISFAGVERGYYVLSSNGTVKPFGQVKFYGDLSTLSPAVSATAIALVPTPDYGGYWILTQSGQSYPFGDATPFSTPDLPSGVTAVSMAVAPNGQSGYLLASNGTVYPLGSATVYGNAPAGVAVNSLALTPSGQGYWILAQNGTVYPFGDAANLGNAQLSSSTLPTYPNGSLLRVTNTSPVFVLLNGTLHHIPNPAILAGLGYTWSNVQVVPTLSNYQVGAPLVVPYPSGTLLKASGQSAVYVIMNGVLHHISSAAVFFGMGYQWSQVMTVPGISPNWPVGPDLTRVVPYLPSGTVLKASSAPTVYMVNNGQLDPIASASAFLAMGYQWSQIVAVSSLPSLPTGPAVTTPARAYPTGTLVRIANTSPVYLVQNGTLRHVTSPQALTNLGYTFSEVTVVTELQGLAMGSDLESTQNPSPAPPPPTAAVSLVPTADGKGYWILTSAGSVQAFGDATAYGSPSATQLNGAQAAALAVTPDQHGYLVETTGQAVYAFGDAVSFGDPSGTSGLVISPATAGNILSMGYGFFQDSNANGPITNGSVADLQQNGSQLSTVMPAWFNVMQNPDGSWSLTNWTTGVPLLNGETNIQYVTNLAHQQHTLIMPSIGAYYNPANGPISTTADVSSLVSQIVNWVNQYNLDGITIDFENNSNYLSAAQYLTPSGSWATGPMTESQASQQYTYFISQLGPALHAIGKKLMVAVYPSPYPNTIYNYAAIAPYVDYINIMTYPQHNSATYPGPTAGYPWVEGLIQGALATGVSPQQIVLGVAPYGHSWTLSNSSGLTGNNFITNRAVQQLLAATPASGDVTPTATWDPVQKEIFFTAGAPAQAPPAPLSQSPSSLNAVKNLQGLLNYILARYNISQGQDPPPALWIDGIYGSATAADVTQFQQDFNVQGATPGVYDSATQAALTALISQWQIGNTVYWDETSRSFQDRLALALKYNLAGVASWRMPFETSGYWNALAIDSSVIHF
ncbi:MAG: glycosyl hydrolase family 18 protein [Thermaerobacter sp.]|nr:glycosyl hydrolase family 18 protein [Thermaerobacter sp.]